MFHQFVFPFQMAFRSMTERPPPHPPPQRGRCAITWQRGLTSLLLLLVTVNDRTDRLLHRNPLSLDNWPRYSFKLCNWPQGKETNGIEFNSRPWVATGGSPFWHSNCRESKADIKRPAGVSRTHTRRTFHDVYPSALLNSKEMSKGGRVY